MCLPICPGDLPLAGLLVQVPSAPQCFRSSHEVCRVLQGFSGASTGSFASVAARLAFAASPSAFTNRARCKWFVGPPGSSRREDRPFGRPPSWTSPPLQSLSLASLACASPRVSPLGVAATSGIGPVVSPLRRRSSALAALRCCHRRGPCQRSRSTQPSVSLRLAGSPSRGAACWPAGLLHPAAGHGVRRVSDLLSPTLLHHLSMASSCRLLVVVLATLDPSEPFPHP